MSAPAFAFAADPDVDEKTLVAPSLSSIDLELLGRPAPRPPVESVKVPMPAAPPSRRARQGTPPIASPGPLHIDTNDASVDIDADTAFFDDGADVAGAPAEPFDNMPSDSAIGALDGAEADETAGLDTAPAARTRSGALVAPAPPPPRFDRTDPIAPRLYRRAQSPHPLPLAAPPSPPSVSQDVSIEPAAYAPVASQTAAPRTGSYPTTGPYTGSIATLARAPALLPGLSIAARSTTHLICTLLAAVALGVLLGWLLFG